MIGWFVKAVCGLALNGFMKLFWVNRDNRDGKLEAVNKAQGDALNEIKIAADAGRSVTAGDSVQHDPDNRDSK